MCVIYVCKDNLPDEEELRRGASCNRDGAGVSWYDEKSKKIKWVKGLASKAEAVVEVLKDRPLPYVIHFRATSAGSSCHELTHPFPIDKEASTFLEGQHSQVFYQNGTWRKWDNVLRDVVLYNSGMKLPEGPWNDTRALAFLAYHKGEDMLSFLEDDSRLLIHRNDPESPFVYWGKWHDKKGWSQSVLTESQIYRTKDFVSYGMGGDWGEDWDDTDYEELAKRNVAQGSKTPIAELTAGNYVEWTPQEMEELLKRAKEELASAKSNCDLYA